MARPLRIPGFGYTGAQRYSVTICAHERRPHFDNGDSARLVIAQFLQSALQNDIAILAYCIMPEHMHMVVEGTTDHAGLLPFVRSAKQRSGFLFKQRNGARLWQKGYFEHVLRSDERTVNAIKYVVQNPLRRQLVEDVRDYPYWGSTVYMREQILDFIGSVADSGATHEGSYAERPI